MTISTARMPRLSTRISEVEITDDLLTFRLEDGRVLSVPTVWFPRLDGASPQARAQWELFDGAMAVHWPELDEDISAAGLLGVPDLARHGRSHRSSTLG